MRNVRRIRLLLHGFAGTCLLAAAGAVVLGVQPLTTTPETSSAPVRRVAFESDGPDKTAHPTHKDFRASFQLNLQRPLFDPPPPPVPKAAPAPPPPPLTLRLLGTVIEVERSQALFLTQAGDIVCAYLGDTVDGATVHAIHSTHVEVKQQDRVQTLQVPTE